MPLEAVWRTKSQATVVEALLLTWVEGCPEHEFETGMQLEVIHAVHDQEDFKSVERLCAYGKSRKGMEGAGRIPASLACKKRRGVVLR